MELQDNATPPPAPKSHGPTPKRLRERVRVPVRIAGWALLGFLLFVSSLAVFLWAVYTSEKLVVSAVPYKSLASSAGLIYSLPEPIRKSEDSWTQPSSPIKLGDSRQHSGQDRDRQLVNDLNNLAVTNATMPELKIDQSAGITTVLAGSRVLATVLPEDLPDYAAQLTPAARKGVEHQLASQWCDGIHNHLLQRFIERTPGFLNMVGLSCFLLFLACLCLHRSTGIFGHYLLDSPFWSLKALIWCSWAIVVANLIPGAEVIANALRTSTATPLAQFIFVSILVNLATQLGRFSINRYFDALRKTQRFQATVRMELRLKTLRHASRFLLRLAIYLVGALVLINLLGFHWQTLLTGAGLVGVAITWIGQDLFRDFLAGLNILLEDQYGVGDLIESGPTLGTVEAFTLRSTKVRSADGSLTTIPNQDVKRVKNLSTGWSQVDLRVPIAPHMRTQACLQILTEEVAALQADSQEKIQGSPQILGVEELGREGIVLRALIKCPPGEQFSLRRELNLRIKARFEREGIELR